MKRSISFTVPQLPVQDVIDSVRSSVVQVVVAIDPDVPAPSGFVNGVWVAGTGSFVNKNGDVATAYHVVSAATSVINTLHGQSFEASLEIAVALPNADVGRGGTISQNVSHFPIK